VAAGLEDLVEVSPDVVSGLTTTVAEAPRDMVAVSETVRWTKDQLNVTRTPHRVQAPAQSHAQVVVEVEVADVLCVERSVATAATTRRSRQLSFAATSNHGHRQSHPTTDHRETVPGVRQRATGLRHPHPPAVPVGPFLQSDRPPTSGPIWTGTPDGLRTSRDVNDIDLTDVKTPYLSFSVPVTTSVAANATASDSAVVNTAATASCFAPSLVNSSQFVDVPMLNMLPHVIAEGMAPNITVTIHSVQTPMMLDSGAQISVLPSDIAAAFDPPISLSRVTREVRTFGNHQVTLQGPVALELQLCGLRICRPLYFIDALTPVIGWYDLMQAARLVMDVANKRVWLRRPESVTKGPISPNPEFPVSDSSVHSSVAMTEPQHAHRVVVQKSTASSAGTLDINPPTVSSNSDLFGNSMSSSQAITQEPSAHSGLVPVQRSRPPFLFKPFRVLASRKRRRTVSDDSPTPLQESSTSATFTDVNQPDVKRVYTDQSRT